MDYLKPKLSNFTLQYLQKQMLRLHCGVIGTKMLMLYSM